MGSSLLRLTPTQDCPPSLSHTLTMKYLVFIVLFASVAYAYEQDAELQLAKDEDRAFFFRFLDELLFDDDFSQSGAQRRMFRDQGLLGMPMPDDLRDDASFTGQLYSNFKEMCYSNACKFGLNNLLKTVSGMFGIA